MTTLLVHLEGVTSQMIAHFYMDTITCAINTHYILYLCYCCTENDLPPILHLLIDVPFPLT